MVLRLAKRYLKGYTQQQIATPPVFVVRRTDAFDTWLINLADLRARAKILLRIRRAERGNFGDVRMLASGVFEMRIDCGPGYRVYYARQARTMYLLLCGGTKSRQWLDIKHAELMWSEIKEGLS